MFRCSSKGILKWHFSNPNTPVIGNQSILEILNVSKENAGFYYCYGQYPGGKRHFLASSALDIESNYITV